jgi:hypothetical protein
MVLDLYLEGKEPFMGKITAQKFPEFGNVILASLKKLL